MSNIRILFIDDETAFTATLLERMELRNITAMSAPDGHSGIAMMDESVRRGTPFEVIVLDVLMPGMDGLETLRHLRQRHPHIPVVVLTGHGSTRDGMKAMQLGAVDYLVKPVDIDELVRVIHNAAECAGALAPKVCTEGTAQE